MKVDVLWFNVQSDAVRQIAATLLPSMFQFIFHRPSLSATNKTRRNIDSYLGAVVRAILGNRVRVPPNDRRLEAGRTVLCHMNVAIA